MVSIMYSGGPVKVRVDRVLVKPACALDGAVARHVMMQMR